MGIITNLRVDEAYDLVRNCQFMENRHSLAFVMLFEYYEQVSNELNEDMRFDPISWFCEWYEFSGATARHELLKEIDETHFASKGYDVGSVGDIVEYLTEHESETVLFDRDPVNNSPIVLLKVR